MKKFIALFLVFSINSLYGNLYAKERRGAIVEIFKIRPKMKETVWIMPDMRGELIAVKKNSLLLVDYYSRTDVSVDVSDINKITIVKKSKTLLGAGLGLVVGGVFGGIIGYSHEASANGWGFGYAFIPIFGLVGALLGALGGATVEDEIIQIEGKSESEIKEVLEELRKKARVPNFQ